MPTGLMNKLSDEQKVKRGQKVERTKRRNDKGQIKKTFYKKTFAAMEMYLKRFLINCTSILKKEFF